MTLFFESLMQQVQLALLPDNLSVALAAIVTKTVVATSVLLVYYLLWLTTKFILSRTLTTRVDPTTNSFVNTLVKFTLFTLAIFASMNSVGIKTTALLTSLGIAGLTIGFAAKDALSNIISGILIFLDRPFVLGDLVEVEGQYGKVDRITLRSTRIITSDGKMLAVPNTEIINKTVSSYTNFPHLRIDIEVCVGTKEDLAYVRSILLDQVSTDDSYMEDPAPRVVVTRLNDYNVQMELQAWLKDERSHVEKKYMLREKVFNTLTEAGIDMPYETIKLTPLEMEHSRSDSE